MGSIILRLVLCIVFAGIIGFERQGHYHPAGMRTHILVCIGSAVTMMIGQQLYEQYGTDPSRISAQVISGIGFLGVGTIISNGGHVRGITTAAGLWASACMGLALGAGLYAIAIPGFAAIVFTLVVMRRIYAVYSGRHPKELRLLVHIRSLSDLVYVTKQLRIWGITIQNTEIKGVAGGEDEENYRVLLEIHMNAHVDTDALLVELHQEDCVLFADYVRRETEE